MLEWQDYMKIFVSLLVIIDPFGAVPIFVSLTADEDRKSRHQTAWVASVTIAGVLLGSILFGDLLLQLLGISISSFKVGGGILLLLTAIAMLQAKQVASKHTPEEDQENLEKESVGVVPLAIPLLAGPGAISTVIIYAHNAPLLTKLTLCLITLTIVVITWLTLYAAIRLSHMMSKTALNIAIRLMGLILASIAIEFIAGGLGELLPGLKP